jgi:glycosyltransferase
MKEVCIVNYTSNAAVYGIGTYIREYAYCLVAIGCKVNLIELGTDKNNTGFLVKERGNVREIHIPYLAGSGFEPYNKGVCRLLRLYIQDSEELVFHFHYSQSESLLDEVKKHFPLSKSVFTIHYLSWSASLQGDSSLFEEIIRRRNSKKMKDKYGYLTDGYSKEKAFLEKVDHIVCLSDDTYNLIHNLYEIKSNLWLIPNGLRKKYRRLSDKQKKDLREKYHLHPDEKILLFVGRIDPIKGINPLLSCFNEVLKEYPNCRLVVIGDGSINEAIKNSGAAGSKILLTGRMDSKTLYRWYQIADIALFPSYYEECSYVGIEMMMYGLPVVASDGYSVKNMFHDHINARIAKIENRKRTSKFEENLKRVILEVLNSDLSELQKGAGKMYKSKYSIEKMQRGYLDLLNAL